MGEVGAYLKVPWVILIVLCEVNRLEISVSNDLLAINYLSEAVMVMDMWTVSGIRLPEFAPRLCS